MRWCAATSSSSNESRRSGGAADLLFERAEGDLEGVDGIRVRDDVVCALQHRHLVDAERRARQPLGQFRAGAGDPYRHVQELPALAEHLRNRAIEAIPVDDVGAAEL